VIGMRASAALWVLAFAGPAWPQALERHLPPAPAPAAPQVSTPETPEASLDDRPLGANLSSLVLIGPQTPAANGAEPRAPGIDANAVPRLADPGARAALARFLGKPLSRKLISEIEAEIVRIYRREDYPFVEVSTPEQEIDRGVLQIRVIEFHIGKIVTVGADAAAAARIAKGIRLKRGYPINSPRLVQDLDWLGRYPFRSLQPAFAPGAALGETDLQLSVVSAKPWQAQVSYANDGSKATGWDRISLSGVMGAPRLNDAVLSANVTGSPDFWAAHGDPFGERHPLYQSAAARLVLPTAPRQALSATVNGVETNETLDPFKVRQRTFEADIAYQSALSNFLPLPGDLSLSFETTRQTKSTYFGDFEVLLLSLDVFQFSGAWSAAWSDGAGRSSLSVAVHGSPGGLNRSSSDDALLIFTNGRADAAAYVSASLDFRRTTDLRRGWLLTNEASAQYAGQALPDPEQVAIGGDGAVRGYSYDDGAFDDGLVLRNELSAPQVRLPLLPLDLVPMAFGDFGVGRNEALRRDTVIGSVGVGADMRLGAATATLRLAYPLADASFTRRGAWRLEARVSVTR
jgi:hemolysin activation/secretion protein